MTTPIHTMKKYDVSDSMTRGTLQRLIQQYTTLLSRTLTMGLSTVQDSLLRILHSIGRLDAQRLIQVLLNLVQPSRRLLDDVDNDDNEKDNEILPLGYPRTKRRTYQRPCPLPQQQVKGLINVGNTCFMNATLQALASLDSFGTYLEHLLLFQYDTPSTAESLLQILDSINGYSSIEAPDPRGLLSLVAMKHEQFRNVYEQQDAEEFLQSVMNMVTDESEGIHTQSLANILLIQLEDDDTDLYDDLDEENIKDKLILTTSMDGEEKKQDDPSLPTIIDASDNQQLQRQKQTVPSIATTLSYMTPSPMHGWQGSPLQCCVCQYVRPIQNEVFLDIPIVPTSVSNNLPIKTAASKFPSCFLIQCLQNYTAVELVKGVECPSCTRHREVKYWREEVALLQGVVKTLESRKDQHDELLESQDDLRKALTHLEHLETCDPDEVDIPMIRDMEGEKNELVYARSEARKCMLLTRLPSILCIHVQRRCLDSRGFMTKTVQHVAFPERLDMSTLCAYGNNNPNTASFAGSAFKRVPTSTTPIWYRLKSVIEHVGNAHGGHYQCYRNTDAGWMFISDECVRPIDWKQVQLCEAYMLFYEAIP